MIKSNIAIREIENINRKYARIAVLIDHTWGTPECKKYIEKLIFSTSRFDRQGFPEDVMKSLMALLAEYPETPDIWELR